MNGENRQLITDWLTLDELDLQTLGRKTQGKNEEEEIDWVVKY